MGLRKLLSCCMGCFPCLRRDRREPSSTSDVEDDPVIDRKLTSTGETLSPRKPFLDEVGNSSEEHNSELDQAVEEPATATTGQTLPSSEFVPGSSSSADYIGNSPEEDNSNMEQAVDYPATATTEHCLPYSECVSGRPLSADHNGNSSEEDNFELEQAVEQPATAITTGQNLPSSEYVSEVLSWADNIGNSSEEDNSELDQSSRLDVATSPVIPKGLRWCRWFIPLQTLDFEKELNTASCGSEPQILVPVLRNREIACDQFGVPEPNPTDDEGLVPSVNIPRKLVHFNELVKCSMIPGLDDDTEHKSKGFHIVYNPLKLGPSPDGGLCPERTIKNSALFEKLVMGIGGCSKPDVPSAEDRNEKEACDRKARLRSRMQNLGRRMSWENDDVDDNNNNNSSTTNLARPSYPPPPIMPLGENEFDDPGHEPSEPSASFPSVAKNEGGDGDPDHEPSEVSASVPSVSKNEDDENEDDPVHSEPEDQRTVDDVGNSIRSRLAMSLNRLTERYASYDESL